MRQEQEVDSPIQTAVSEINTIINGIEKDKNAQDTNASKGVLDNAKDRLEKMERLKSEVHKDEMSNLNFHDTATEIKQLSVDITKQHAEDGIITNTLGKRAYDDTGDVRRDRMEGIKYRTKCMGFGKTGNWFKYRPECTREMDEKMNTKRRKYGNDEDGQKKGFFRMFSAKGSVSRPDPNPIIDEGDTTSTGGMLEVAD